MVDLPPRLEDLQPGDVQLFRGSGFFGWLTRTKCWSDVGHVEVVISPTLAVTARSEGVRAFPIRADYLYVYRPTVPFDLGAAWTWFTTVDPQDGIAPNQQGYDWWGLALSFYARKQGRTNKKMFCSEACARFLKKGKVEAWADDFDCDAISPAQFKQSPVLKRLRRLAGAVPPVGSGGQPLAAGGGRPSQEDR